jgi:SAM-dependent methyltransferase
MREPLYDRIGVGYSSYRRPDVRIACRVEAALGDALSVVNVGAGSGSYEPPRRKVTAVEPSAIMVSQRPRSAAPVVRATAEALPFAAQSFDASLAVLTLHHWPEWERGLREMLRVSRRRVVIFTADPDHPGFWLTQEYFPEIALRDGPLLPQIPAIERVVGPLEVRSVPVPSDCSDGFLGAYWRRPEAYLDGGVRSAISSFALLGDRARSGLRRLERDLASGAWHSRHGSLLEMSELDLGYRLLVARL